MVAAVGGSVRGLGREWVLEGGVSRVEDRLRAGKGVIKMSGYW